MTIGVTTTGSTFDKDSVSCQYLIAERFVRSILKWKCPIPKAEFNDISKVIIRRLIDTLEYTPPQDEDRKSQQLRFLADAIACWVTGVLSEVAENQEKKLIERCRKKEEEMRRDEDEDDDDDDDYREDKRKDLPEEGEDEEDEEDEDLTDKSEERERGKSRGEVEEDIEEMEESLRDVISGAEGIDEIAAQEMEGEEQAEEQVDSGMQTESKVEQGTEPQAEVTAEAETEAKPETEAKETEVEVKPEAVDEKVKEEMEKEQLLTAELAPEPETEMEIKTEIKTEPPEEEEIKSEIEIKTEPPDELPTEPIDEQTEEQPVEEIPVEVIPTEETPAEGEEPVLEAEGPEEITDEGAIPTEELEASVPTEEEEGVEALETEEGKKEESVTALETKVPSEMGLPKDVMKELVELFKTDLPFLTFGKIIDTINKMIADTPENTGEDPITNGIHRAIYEKLKNIVLLENPELLTEELENVMNVVCGKIANWLRSILSKSQLAFMKQFVPEVESKEIRDWTKWLSYISDVAKDWNVWLRGVIERMFEMESEPVTRGEWRDWTKSVDTKALLWRRFHLQIRHQAHRNVTMITGRRVVKTGSKKPISANPSEQLFSTDLST